jgi:predicted ribosomally synthesized peptide with SipW-like signal peptide
MKRILFGLMALAVCIGLMGGAFAYLGDKETAVDNSYTAGTLNLTVNGQDDTNVGPVVKVNIAPHEVDWTYQDFNKQWVVKNEGSLPGNFWAEIKNIKNYEHDLIEPEANAGDVTSGTLEGELGALMWVQFSRNQAPWGYLSPHYKPFNDAANQPTTAVLLAPGESLNLYMQVDWFNDKDFYGIDNQGQSDELEFDVVFHLEQDFP